MPRSVRFCSCCHRRMFFFVPKTLSKSFAFQGCISLKRDIFCAQDSVHSLKNQPCQRKRLVRPFYKDTFRPKMLPDDKIVVVRLALAKYFMVCSCSCASTSNSFSIGSRAMAGKNHSGIKTVLNSIESQLIDGMRRARCQQPGGKMLPSNEQW